MVNAFPGGTAVSWLDVYEDESVDGLAGGTPHFHTASTEGYVVVSGRGALQTINPSGFTETPLEAGVILWFTPGTIHRAVNLGSLRVLCIMQNAGLPEAGDAVMCFPDEVLASADRYREAATLPDGLGEDTAEAVRRRRDLGVTGFLQLRAAIAGGDNSALERMYNRAANLVQPRIEGWRSTWENTVRAETSHTDEVLTALAMRDSSSLLAGGLQIGTPLVGDRKFGMCGRLRTFDLTPAA